MLNVSGGLVAGDRLLTDVAVGPEAHALLTTASATKVYRSEGAPSAQHTRITVNGGAALEYLPDHMIPHGGAAIDQSLRAEVAADGKLILYDAIATGRIGRGERWQFRFINSEIAITRDGRPLYLNRTRIIPSAQPVEQFGWMEHYDYLGTTVIIGEENRDWTEMAALIDAALQPIAGVRGSAGELSRSGCVARFLTTSATGLNQAAMAVWAIARRKMLGREIFALRK